MNAAHSNDPRQRSLPNLLDDAHAAAQRLATATRSWPVFMPNTPAVDELANTVEGLKRTLCELRPYTATTPRTAASQGESNGS